MAHQHIKERLVQNAGLQCNVRWKPITFLRQCSVIICTARNYSLVSN